MILASRFADSFYRSVGHPRIRDGGRAILASTPAEAGRLARDPVIRGGARAILAALAIAFIGGLAPQVPVHAQEPAGQTAGAASGRTLPPLLRATKTTDPPRIDGILDDAAWSAVAPASGFVQMRPNSGRPATEETEVRILYSDDAVYIGARMHDRDPDRIISRLGRRDEDVAADAFYVAFDSYFDRRTAFAFGVSVAGTQYDELLYGDVRDDSSWDAVWQSATRTDESGWTAELRIPLSQLRFARPSGDENDGSGGNGLGSGPGSRGDPETEPAGSVWGINFWRQLPHSGETSSWSPIPADGGRFVSAFGTWRGIEGIRPRNNLEIRPYVRASATRAPLSSGNPFYSATDMSQTAGGDLKYGVTNNITLDLSVNPDFGQIEADPSVVNLSVFESFFPEKRPFFQEGADIFDFEIGAGDDDNESLFYSRRIGRAPQGSVRTQASHVDAPAATAILGAAKLSGKTASGWSIGFLDAVTSSQHARFATSDGAIGEQLVEPATNYAVGRLIKNFRDGETAIGLIATAANRRIGEESPVSFLAGSAYAGGLDFRHRFGGGNYQLSGHALGSLVSGSPGAIARLQRSSVRYFQRTDADHVELDPDRTSLFGTQFQFSVSRVGGGHWRYGVFGQSRSPGFEVNDLGFQQNADQNLGASWLSYEQYAPQGPFRRWGLNTSIWSGWTFGGERLFSGGNINGNFQLKNYWYGFMGFGQQLAGKSPTALRGGPSIYYPASWNGWAGLFTDSRRPIRLGAVINLGGEYGTETSRFSVSPRLTVRPVSHIELSLSPSFSWNNRDWQYVAQPRSAEGTHFVFGRLQQRTVSLTTRLDYSFTPNLSLQLYAQPFVSAGSYDQMMQVLDPRAPAFDDRFRAFGEDEIRRVEAGSSGGYLVDQNRDGQPDYLFRDPDFTVKSLRANLVLRWQYRPGSAVFVVWGRDQRSYANDGEFRFGRDLGDIASIPSTNIFMVKFDYWLGL